MFKQTSLEKDLKHAFLDKNHNVFERNNLIEDALQEAITPQGLTKAILTTALFETKDLYTSFVQKIVVYAERSKRCLAYGESQEKEKQTKFLQKKNHTGSKSPEELCIKKELLELVYHVLELEGGTVHV